LVARKVGFECARLHRLGHIEQQRALAKMLLLVIFDYLEVMALHRAFILGALRDFETLGLDALDQYIMAAALAVRDDELEHVAANHMPRPDLKAPSGLGQLGELFLALDDFILEIAIARDRLFERL